VIAAPTTRMRRPTRLVRVALACLAGALAAGSIQLALVGGGDDGSAVSRAERKAADIRSFLSYERAVQEVGERGAQVVIYGMKPGLSDIAESRLPSEVLVRMATGWARSVEQLRADLSALTPPAYLADAAAALDDAYGLYQRTAEALATAAASTGSVRAGLVEQAAALGNRADAAYDEALDALARARARLGLPEKEIS
jgi:hypothetical protein